MEITQNQIEFFRENGYLFKRNILDRSLIGKCLNHYWESAPEGFHRDDPNTWRGMISQNAFTREGIQHQDYDWKDFTLKDTTYGRSLIAEDSSIIEVVNALARSPIEHPHTRGIFGVLPGSAGRGFHIDGPRVSPFIGVTGLLEDVGPNAGNFTFCPKSHHRVSELIENGTLDTLRDKSSDMYNKDLWKDALTECPVQFVGEAGDIVFWHDSLVHRYTENLSNHIRLAMFVDFYIPYS